MNFTTIPIAIGAAMASALLYAGLALQSTTAVGLALAAPVPIAIAGLGWGSFVGLLAAFGAPLFIVALTGNFPSAISLAALLTVPTAIATALVLRRFAVAAEVDTPHSPHPIETSAPTTAWMPVSRILFVLAILAAGACVFVGYLLGFDPEMIRPALLQSLTASGPDLDPAAQIQLENLVAVVVQIVPLVQPAILLVTLVVCIHLAASIVRRSGRLDRPKDDLPSITSMPQDALLLFAVALAGTFLTGPAGWIASAFTGALGTAFALVGLARFHKRTRGRPARGLALFMVYASIVILTFPIFVFVVVGIVDVWRYGERFLPSRSR